jgi:hypothetical protein
VDATDGNGVEVVELLPAVPPHDDEVRSFKNAEVFHDPEAGHVSAFAELSEGLAAVRKEAVEERPTNGVGERFEDGVVAVVHDES